MTVLTAERPLPFNTWQGQCHSQDSQQLSLRRTKLGALGKEEPSGRFRDSTRFSALGQLERVAIPPGTQAMRLPSSGVRGHLYFGGSTVILVPASCSHHHTAQLGHHTPCASQTEADWGFSEVTSPSLHLLPKDCLHTSPLHNLDSSCTLEPFLCLAAGKDLGSNLALLTVYC